jgi:hypothetical protein
MTEAGYAEFSQIKGIAEYTGADVSLLADTGIASLSYDANKVLTYTAISGMPWDRTLKLNGVSSYKAGTYVALRMKFTGATYN